MRGKYTPLISIGLIAALFALVAILNPEIVIERSGNTFLRNTPSESELFPLITLSVDGIMPVGWLSSDSLVVETNDSVRSLSVESAEFGDVLVRLATESMGKGINCYSSGGSLVSVVNPDADGGATFMRIPNWSEKEGWTSMGTTTMKRYLRTADCGPILVDQSYFRAPSNWQGSERNGIRFGVMKRFDYWKYPSYGYELPLSRSRDAIDARAHYHTEEGTPTVYGALVQLSENEEPIYLNLPNRSLTKPYLLDEIRGTFDELDGTYVWYLYSENFDSSHKDNSWPLPAWRISSDFSEIDSFQLPAGPWVRRYTFADELGHWGTSAVAFQDFDLVSSNGRVFLSVRGKLIKDKHAGVYELVNDEARDSYWMKRFAGQLVSAPVVSPDGCMMGFRVAEGIQVMDLCTSQ